MTSKHAPGNDPSAAKRSDKFSRSSAGGRAAAASMTPEQKAERSRKGANARWHTNTSSVVAGSPDAPLQLNGIEIECYVLKGEVRVITQRSMLRGLGRRQRGGEAEGDLPPFLASRSLESHLSPEIMSMSEPIVFRHPNGTQAKGYRAELLPEVCEAYLRAREAGTLASNQEHLAQRAELLMRGLARVGIIALVDEATGYEAQRSRNALADMLEMFIAKELAAWEKTFPDEFYVQMCRLNNVEYGSKYPIRFGKMTNDVVYRRLAPGVLEELKSQQVDRGGKLHQQLTRNVGYQKLTNHLSAVVARMQDSESWDEFKEKMNRFMPILSGEDIG